MIGRFEHDMSEAVDALRQEKDRSAQAVEQLNDKVILTTIYLYKHNRPKHRAVLTPILYRNVTLFLTCRR